jgi:hypothetical protein
VKFRTHAAYDLHDLISGGVEFVKKHHDKPTCKLLQPRCKEYDDSREAASIPFVPVGPI